MNNRCILITGATGLLGAYLVDAASTRGHVITTSRRGGDKPCDLTNEDAVGSLLMEINPDVVVHAAAYTNVDGCEKSPSAADTINHRVTTYIANSLSEDARLMYLSTDQVYGEVGAPHIEGSEAPVNVYGKSKLAGERAALDHPGGVAARINFFAASRTPNRLSLSDFFVLSLRQRRNVPLFRDTQFSPLHANTLASILFDMIDAPLYGTYNVASREGFSKAEFALKVAAHFALQTDTAKLVNSVSQPGRAKRSLDLRMETARIETALGRRMPTLNQEIAKL